MILPRPEDALHRGMLYRLLIEIADNAILSRSLIFKGGTCAALLKELDRFSVDLDFDLSSNVDKNEVKNEFERIFKKLSFEIRDQSANTTQYVLKYEAPQNQRNTLQLDAVSSSYKADEYRPFLLYDLERYMVCQTIETMFAHKLVAVMDRYEKHNAIAGRDIYDMYHFFLNGKTYNRKVIQERTGKDPRQYLLELVGFVQNNVTNTIINEDLNVLLPYDKFSAIRKSLKQEVVSLLRSEIEAEG